MILNDSDTWEKFLFLQMNISTNTIVHNNILLGTSTSTAPTMKPVTQPIITQCQPSTSASKLNFVHCTECDDSDAIFFPIVNIRVNRIY